MSPISCPGPDAFAALDCARHTTTSSPLMRTDPTGIAPVGRSLRTFPRCVAGAAGPAPTPCAPVRLRSRVAGAPHARAALQDHRCGGRLSAGSPSPSGTSTKFHPRRAEVGSLETFDLAGDPPLRIRTTALEGTPGRCLGNEVATSFTSITLFHEVGTPGCQHDGTPVQAWDGCTH